MKGYRLFTIKFNFVNTKTVLKRYHLSKVTPGKEHEQAKLIENTYKLLYNTQVSQLIGIDYEGITEERYKELQRELEEEI
ncbi:hypothetical protein AR454_28680 [Bacillus mycoides]|uniref:hypothetical protein n=1 Tax=Bacillus TaxID=1386 RepID=UPI001E429C2F|nr:hypothetical protein [Bacillus mycoides]MCD4646340.1 hypothetical protein [Bacillus mycoides]